MAYTDVEVYEVWKKCNERCVYGSQIKVLLTDYGKTWEIDHANPSGVDDLRNRLVACIKHNRQKGDKTRQEFERWLEANPSEKPCG